MRNPLPLILSTCALTCLLLGLTACGGQESLEAASEKVVRISRDVETARERVVRHEVAVKEAMESLEGARSELAEIETKLSDARQNVEDAVSDTDLFRAVQSALLDDDDLEDLAISARVSQRVVTLEGSVPSEDLKVRAERIAGAALGVAAVVNQIRVEVPAKG